MTIEADEIKKLKHENAALQQDKLDLQENLDVAHKTIKGLQDAGFKEIGENHDLNPNSNNQPENP